jgi:hypothetical protein
LSIIRLIQFFHYSLFWENSDEEYDSPRSANDPRPEDFFREILLSYRIIFGQDGRSWRAFKKESSELSKDRSCSDPLLSLLCGMAWDSPEAIRLYTELEADEKEDVSAYYSADDFPFLGKRLLELQSFSQGQHPYDWKVLWHDRRNVTTWWTFWAVFLIGGATILLAMVQVGFQIWQSVVSWRQSKD